MPARRTPSLAERQQKLQHLTRAMLQRHHGRAGKLLVGADIISSHKRERAQGPINRRMSMLSLIVRSPLRTHDQGHPQVASTFTPSRSRDAKMSSPVAAIFMPLSEQTPRCHPQPSGAAMFMSPPDDKMEMSSPDVHVLMSAIFMPASLAIASDYLLVPSYPPPSLPLLPPRQDPRSWDTPSLPRFSLHVHARAGAGRQAKADGAVRVRVRDRTAAPNRGSSNHPCNRHNRGNASSF